MEELELKAQDLRGFICPFINNCDEEKYSSCYNHSHVLCLEFENFYEEQRRQNIIT